MSIPLGKSVSICDKEFCSYQDMAKHMRFLLSEYVKKTGVVDNKHLIKSLKAFKESLVFGENSGAYEYLVKENFQKVCVDLMKLCVEQGDMKLLTALLSSIITITDNSMEMCKVLTENGLDELLVNQTIDVCQNNFKVKLPKQITADSLFDQLILVIDNIASHPRFQSHFLRCTNIRVFKEKICQYMNSKNHRTRILTMSALTWLIGEDDDKTRLEFYSSIIDNFVEYINRAMDDKNRRCEGLRITELLKVIISLSNVDALRHAMLRMKKLIALIQSILKSGSSTAEEIEKALAILYNLSFRSLPGSNEENGTVKIQDVCDVDAVVKPFINRSETGIKKHADGLISELKVVQKERKKDIIYDIFISYDEDDSDTMERIANTLAKKGLKVWRTKEYVKGHDISDVKNSIEQSRLLVMGISNSYYNNQYCHAESKHAYELEKPIVPILIEPQYKPKDWLEKIIKLETRIDFSSEKEFDSFAEKLIKHIETKFGPVTVSQIRTPKLNTAMKPVSLDYDFIQSKDIKQWSKEEVGQWLKHNELFHLQQNFGTYDGKMIEYLRKMRITAPEQYAKRLREDLHLAFSDEMNFDGAIEALKG